MILAVSGPVWGLLAVIYFVLLVVLGVTSLRKGHWIMFIIGIFLPLFWIIGAVMPPVERD
jgi:ATP/ADP translocase